MHQFSLYFYYSEKIIPGAIINQAIKYYTRKEKSLMSSLCGTLRILFAHVLHWICSATGQKITCPRKYPGANMH